MGGFLKRNETLDDAASRVLNRLTGVKNIYMEQFYSFSEINRDLIERTVSTSYYAVINIIEVITMRNSKEGSRVHQ